MRGKRARVALGIIFRGLLFVTVWSVVYVLVHQSTWNVLPEVRSVKLVNLSTQVETTTHVESFVLHLAPHLEYNDTQIVKEWSKKVLSVPSRYSKKPTGYKQSKCASYPNFPDLNFDNELWQHWTSNQGGASFHIFGAYWDDRPRPQSVVRVLLMVNRINPPNVTCQLWYNNEKGIPRAVASNSSFYTYIWNKKWGNYKDGGLQPYLLTCPISGEKDSPESVSLVDKPCDNATNNIRLFSYTSEKIDKVEKNKTLKFAVCVKGLNFFYDDVSVRLVEWLEFLKIFGVDKVFSYDLSVHPNVSKVLDYYKEKNFLHRYALTLPGNQLNDASLMDFYLRNRKVAKRQNEVIPYNDCFYRHRHEYDYLALLDIDEIIVPLKTTTWDGLIKSLETRKTIPDSFHASNVYFFDDATHTHGWDKDIPTYMHMLQHIWRARNHTKPGTYVKSFFNTNTVLALHNHLPFKCMSHNKEQRGCRVSSIKVDKAQLQHYRKDCDASIKNSCQNLYHKYLIVDDNLKRFTNPVVNNVKQVLIDLGILEII